MYTFFSLQNHLTSHSEERLINLTRGRECFVGLSILLVYGEDINTSESLISSVWAVGSSMSWMVEMCLKQCSFRYHNIINWSKKHLHRKCLCKLNKKYKYKYLKNPFELGLSITKRGNIRGGGTRTLNFCSQMVQTKGRKSEWAFSCRWRWALRANFLLQDSHS